ncbi:hypothetical protein F5X99DRAFT_404419 [Biscogniauxia marginata]|nr:hypothetical protein F5X99DRAFT_404419 [Biscogniauxia marginata]
MAPALLRAAASPLGRGHAEHTHAYAPRGVTPEQRDAIVNIVIPVGGLLIVVAVLAFYTFKKER